LQHYTSNRLPVAHSLQVQAHDDHQNQVQLGEQQLAQDPRLPAGLRQALSNLALTRLRPHAHLVLAATVQQYRQSLLVMSAVPNQAVLPAIPTATASQEEPTPSAPKQSADGLGPCGNDVSVTGQDVHQEHLSAAQLAQLHPLLYWRLRAKQLLSDNGVVKSNDWSELAGTAGLPAGPDSSPKGRGTGDAGSLSSQSAHVLHNVVLRSGVMADMLVEVSHDSTSNTQGFSTSHPDSVSTSTSSSRPAPTCTFLLTPADLSPKAVEAVLEATATASHPSSTATDGALQVQGSGIAGGGALRKSGRQQQLHQQMGQGKQAQTGSGAARREREGDAGASNSPASSAGSRHISASMSANAPEKAAVRDDQALRQEAGCRGVAWAAQALSESLGPRARQGHVPPKLKVKRPCLI
jgi:hypothetical protein